MGWFVGIVVSSVFCVGAVSTVVWRGLAGEDWAASAVGLFGGDVVSDAEGVGGEEAQLPPAVAMEPFAVVYEGRSAFASASRPPLTTRYAPFFRSIRPYSGERCEPTPSPVSRWRPSPFRPRWLTPGSPVCPSRSVCTGCSCLCWRTPCSAPRRDSLSGPRGRCHCSWRPLWPRSRRPGASSTRCSRRPSRFSSGSCTSLLA